MNSRSATSRGAAKRAGPWELGLGEMSKSETKIGVVMGTKSPVKRELARSMRGSMTETEELLWAHLRKNRLTGLHFRRQQVIDGFIADFYCHEAGIVVEADGSVHDHRPDYDRLRDQIIEARSILVLRFTNDEITSNIEHVPKTIAKAAHDRRQD